MQVQSYLTFNGRTEEAIAFYKKALGAEVEMIMRFKDAPEGQCPPELADKIMHSSFRIGDTVVMPPTACAPARSSSSSRASR